ncbi:MAG: hypothetical protein DRR16_20315 [Candidatus Parabeggiatoa sp. nov. 3]|nr:MAG: hypothetical protein DRR00_10190 [Gammaproteobacteria bacterium]RKZ82171.1 MAG: hypothetical protein DRR16_20315 [Gammaproteobacteria bacterium]
MIPDKILKNINGIRAILLDALKTLPQVQSFRFLLDSSTSVKTGFEQIKEVTQTLHLQKPCEGKITCAIMGSSGHGKTTLMDEMFPNLSERGWLVTDITDTTAQSLRISYAPPHSAALEEVVVNSWNVEQIKSLMRYPEVEKQNKQDNILISYKKERVDVDGSKATFPATDIVQFDKKLALHPFQSAYQVPPEKCRNREFIRAITVKEQAKLINTRPLMTHNERPYNALQLRAIVKDVSLRDSYERIQKWTGLPNNQLASLIFVDTPGLAVNGSVKDEVLRHYLEQKSNHIALQLWKNDELDIVVHLVLCGRQSDFAVLWKTIERECGPAEMESLSERLILAVNGMSLYFTNRDIKKKYEQAETAQHEGDHFASTLEDNIFQKMSPRGRVQPAKICFLDAKSYVENSTTGPYEEAYKKYRPIMEKWVKPGNVGYKTLSELNLLETFKENMVALANPEDRGQGFLVRQILNLVREKGPALLLRKYLVRTGLLAAVKTFSELLSLHYEQDGTMNQGTLQEAVREAILSCLSEPEDLRSIETFATQFLDSGIQEIVNKHSKERKVPKDWVTKDFHHLCVFVKETIRTHSNMSGEVLAQFEQYFDAQEQLWAEHWGYTSAQLQPPNRGFANSRDLLAHCLKLHAREILYQLLMADHIGAEENRFKQTTKDKQQIVKIIKRLKQAQEVGTATCQKYGVKT